METWATMRSAVFSSGGYPDATTGSPTPLHQTGFRRCVFRSRGIHLLIADFSVNGVSTYQQSVGSFPNQLFLEPIQTNFIHGVLVNSNREDVLRDEQPYGVFPPVIEIQCDTHTHTYDSGTKTATGLRGVGESINSGPEVHFSPGRSRRQRTVQQLFFLVDATLGDNLFIWCDYPPHAAISYEMFRLCPVFQTWKAIEIG